MMMLNKISLIFGFIAIGSISSGNSWAMEEKERIDISPKDSRMCSDQRSFSLPLKVSSIPLDTKEATMGNFRDSDNAVYEKPSYVSILDKNKAYIQENGLPVARRISEETDKPLFGATGVLSCIGILGWDSKTKATSVFHMKDLDERIIAFMFLDHLSKCGDEVAEKAKWSLGDLLSTADPDREVIQNALNIVRSSPFSKTIQFTLITDHSENMNKLLKIFKTAGFSRDQIVIDSHTSRILLDRASGKVCKDFRAQHNKPIADIQYLAEDKKDVTPGGFTGFILNLLKWF